MLRFRSRFLEPRMSGIFLELNYLGLPRFEWFGFKVLDTLMFERLALSGSLVLL